MLFTDVVLPPAYHEKKPDTLERERVRKRKHDKRRTRTYSVDPRERRIIAWDGEGMKLSGDGSPQHYVLFGCSVEPETPLVISHDRDELTFFELVDYICDIGLRYPHAFHVGYFFGYDQNMIVKTLGMQYKLTLYLKNAVQVRHDGTTYRVRWIPGKRITLTRERDGKKVTVTIDDIGSFFATSFVKAYRGMLPEQVDSPRFATVVEGKALRADMMFYDMPRVRKYWEAEIACLEQLAEEFRRIMHNAGFILRDWYGPGALANYIRRDYGLVEHEWGGKEANLPPEVHEAVKRSYFGGRFEQFRAGRIEGPVYAYDIRSAYPAAFTELPSMREGGEWVHVRRPTGARLGVYRVRYRNPGDGSPEASMPWEPQPFPHRSEKMSQITYPPMVEGWYWGPELWEALGLGRGTIRVLEGWEWRPVDPDERPWSIFRDMYERRKKLKANGNPSEMAFKLGPNSMYGKAAQRVGWDERKRTPPKAHTLPIAAFITSYCRAAILEIMRGMEPESVIAIETDGIFTTTPPEKLSHVTIGEGLGEWEVKVYDEIIYLQSGVYLTRVGEKWSVKSRGVDASSITYPMVREYLESCKANEEWIPLDLPPKERFLGLGAAVSRSTGRRGPSPFRLSSLHCRWESQERILAIGEKGKRYHIPGLCNECSNEHTAYTGAHTLRVRSPASMLNPVSAPFELPWEDEYREPPWVKPDLESLSIIDRESV